MQHIESAVDRIEQVALRCNSVSGQKLGGTRAAAGGVGTGHASSRSGASAYRAEAVRFSDAGAFACVRDAACVRTRANAIMNPEQFERLLNRLTTVRNTDDLLDIELALGVLDEEDPLSVRALYHLASMRCHLSRGPAPAPPPGHAAG